MDQEGACQWWLWGTARTALARYQYREQVTATLLDNRELAVEMAVLLHARSCVVCPTLRSGACNVSNILGGCMYGCLSLVPRSYVCSRCISSDVRTRAGVFLPAVTEYERHMLAPSAGRMNPSTCCISAPPQGLRLAHAGLAAAATITVACHCWQGRARAGVRHYAVRRAR